MSNLTYSLSDSGLEVVILNTGEAFCTQSSYSRWMNKNQSTIATRCQELEIVEIVDITDFEASIEKPITDQLIKTKINTGNQLQTVVLIPAKIIAHWLLKDNPSEIPMFITYIEKTTGYTLNLSSFKNMKIKNRQQTEKQVQKLLAKKLNGLVEIVCKTGIIDILTEKEVKKVRAWKAAVGQALIYSLEYPDKKPRIHLCGECSEEFKQMVISYCLKLKVLATFEEN